MYTLTGFRFMFVSPASKHGAGTFCCLVPVGISFLALAEFLSSLAWTNQYENYSFLLDHLSVAARFLADVTLMFGAFAALRLALDFARRKFSAMSAAPEENEEHDEDEKDGAKDNLPRRRAAVLAGFCAFSVHALNLAYGIALVLLLFLFARRNWAQYSPLLFYRHYRNEPFQYSPSVFFVAAGLGVLSFVLAGLFGRQRRLRAVSCAPALHSVFQTFCGISSCAAAAIALKQWGGRDLTLAAEWLVTGGCVYFAAGLLRGAGRDMLRGDMTAAFSYEPLFCLPEHMKLFDRSVSWEERTGLSFKSTWCAGYTLRLIPRMALFGGGMLLLSTSLYVVEPHQEALLYRLGVLGADSVKRPGPHFKLPWPIDRADIHDVSRVRNVQIGYVPSASRDYLWNSAHGGEEYALLLGGGSEMIAVNMRVSCRILDLRAYVTRCADPEGLLSSKVYEMMMRRTQSSDLNTMLSVDRGGLSEELAEELSEYASRLGLHVNEVIVESIHPPVDLADVYHGVVGASIQKETLIVRAGADAEKTHNGALREKERAILAAEARQTERVSLARRDMAVYENAFLAWAVSPECYELRKTTDAYRRIIQGGRLYVFSPGAAKDARRYLITNGLNSWSGSFDGK
ncbi:MAG: hypothetical protein LBO82_01940 [Synergistaceae bacterium]|jgi:regulator of protease activity HflC (stomatin/prohibitin superfamily)|nr:hypothetical protein [Synergistaceae bacterium]